MLSGAEHRVSSGSRWQQDSMSHRQAGSCRQIKQTAPSLMQHRTSRHKWFTHTVAAGGTCKIHHKESWFEYLWCLKEALRKLYLSWSERLQLVYNNSWQQKLPGYKSWNFQKTRLSCQLHQEWKTQHDCICGGTPEIYTDLSESFVDFKCPSRVSIHKV